MNILIKLIFLCAVSFSVFGETENNRSENSLLLETLNEVIKLTNNSEKNIERISNLEKEVRKKYFGFSYYAQNYSTKGGSWQYIICDKIDYNTFNLDSYNTKNGEFTVPYSGFYRFSSNGYIATGSNRNDRVAVGVSINGKLKSFSGGQFSSLDSPGPQFSFVVKLKKGDKVKLTTFVAINAIFGAASSVGHEWWFQGEFISK